MGNRSKIILIAEGSNYRYYLTKNKKKTPARLSLKKYCPENRKHLVFTEKK